MFCGNLSKEKIFIINPFIMSFITEPFLYFYEVLKLTREAGADNLILLPSLNLLVIKIESVFLLLEFNRPPAYLLNRKQCGFYKSSKNELLKPRTSSHYIISSSRRRHIFAVSEITWRLLLTISFATGLFQ